MLCLSPMEYSDSRLIKLLKADVLEDGLSDKRKSVGDLASLGARRGSVSTFSPTGCLRRPTFSLGPVMESEAVTQLSFEERLLSSSNELVPSYVARSDEWMLFSGNSSAQRASAFGAPQEGSSHPARAEH